MTQDLEIRKRLEILAELEKRNKLKENLPHLYGYPWYDWAWKFFTSRNKMNLLVAGNQVSKSSSMIRKAIHWATCRKLWPELWATRPTQFWYFYPSRDLATIEWQEKWKKEFMPRGAMKDDATFGWEEDIRRKQIYAVYFKSGITIYFKSYEQDATNMQASSVYAVFGDEECPTELYSELQARLYATRGYFHSAFTATLGQHLWWQAMEGKGKDELFKEAFKQQVSMYDCFFYKDGSKAPWDEQRIQEIKDKCKSQSEIDRRVYGKFAIDENRMYPGFERSRNMKPGHPIPKDWLVYSGVDLGSGGHSHPAAFAFVGVKPDFTEGRVFLAKRLDGMGDTTAGDVLLEYQKARGKMRPVAQFYDWNAKDFFTIAGRAGEPFQAANKDRDSGIRLVNVLFKHDMLALYETDETIKLAIELETLKTTTLKAHAKDDLIDALRFAVTNIPWDFSKFAVKQEAKPKKELTEREKRYKQEAHEIDGLDLMEAEMDEANEMYEYYGYE